MNLEKQEYVKKELAQIFITKNRDDWLKELGDKDVCIAPLNEIWDVEEDPQVKFRKIIINMVTSQGIIKQLAPSIRLNETSASIRTAAPQLGEHNEEILKNLGYSPQQIDSFRKQKVI